MPVSTSVKYFHSAMPSAPVISGTPGTRIAAMRACLITGWGLQTAASVTVAEGVATVSLPNGHVLEPDVVALMAGAETAGLNGEKRILTTSTNAVSFDATGIADQVASGSITIKLAPVGGWEEVFSGTNIAVFRSTDVEGARHFLRVDDTSATNVRVVGYENMTDANTGVGPFPTNVQISGGGWWPAANAANTMPRAWTLIADSKGFRIHIHTATSIPGASGSIWGFGDFASFKSGDAYACALHCATGDLSGTGSPGSGNSGSEYCSSSSPPPGLYFSRSFTTLGGSVSGTHTTSEFFAGGASGSNASQPQAPAYPNGPDNGLVFAKKILLEPNICRRGVDRGWYVLPQNCHAAFSWLQKIDGQGELAGRKLLAIKCGSPASTSSQGVAFFDIIGPWG